MPNPSIGDIAPDFTARTDDGEEFTFSEQFGKPIVLYFYPKDDTPGCTREACDFRDQSDAFAALGAEIIGVSRDSVERHVKFREKYDLGFRLVSDTDGSACNAWGVWVEKKNYGRTYMGIDRSTFIIDSQGIIRKTWRKVRVKGHVDKVLEELRAVANA